MRIWFIYFSFFLLASKISGQDLDIYYKFKNDTLMIRWHPSSPSVWYGSNKEGYQVIVKDMQGITAIDTIIKNTTNVYSKYPETSPQKLLYFFSDRDRIPKSFLDEYDFNLRSEAEIDTATDEVFYDIVSRRQEFLQNAGLFLKLPYTSSDSVNIEVKSLYDTSVRKSVQANINDYDYNDLPKLKAVWSDRKVVLSWNEFYHRDRFIFYNIYLSSDGENFTKNDSLIVNYYYGNDEKLSEYSLPVALKRNNVQYHIRLKAIDFLGQESKSFTEVIGSPSEQLGISPYFKSVRQLRSNHVHLKWSIPDYAKDLVTEYRIYVGEEYDGPYLLDTSGLSPQTYEIKREIPFRSAYFRVVALDREQKEYSSFPHLIVGVDTVAPAIPEKLSYVIDSTGILDIQWKPNSEEDFIGYKLFYSYDTTIEMTLAHTGYLVESSFRDTVELKSTNQNIFFKVTAVDRRNNRSDFSKILVVKKPDILAPVEPVFILADSGPGTAQLKWYASISDDVKEQRLFRRRLGGNGNWELLELWDISIDTTYEDTNLEGFEKYAYTLVVIDSSGNESDASIPVVVMPLPDYRQFDLSAWDVIMDNEEIRISQDLENKAIQKIFIYRKVDDGKLYSIAELDPGTRVFIDENIRSGSSFSYAIKVMFVEGIETPLTEFKTIRK